MVANKTRSIFPPDNWLGFGPGPRDVRGLMKRGGVSADGYLPIPLLLLLLLEGPICVNIVILD